MLKYYLFFPPDILLIDIIFFILYIKIMVLSIICAGEFTESVRTVIVMIYLWSCLHI